MVLTHTCKAILLSTLISFSYLSTAKAADFDQVTQEDWHCFMITEEGEHVNLGSMCGEGSGSSSGSLTLDQRLINFYRAKFCDPRPMEVINSSNGTQDREDFMRMEASYATLRQSLKYFSSREEEKRREFMRTQVTPFVIQSLDDCP